MDSCKDFADGRDRRCARGTPGVRTSRQRCRTGTVFHHAYHSGEFAFLERGDRSYPSRRKPFDGDRWARCRQHPAAEFCVCRCVACVGDGCSASLSPSRVGVCNCLRVRSRRFLAGLPAESPLPRTRDGGDCLHESRHDPLPAVPYVLRHVAAASRTGHCKSCATHRSTLSVLSLWEASSAPPLLTV